MYQKYFLLLGKNRPRLTVKERVLALLKRLTIVYTEPQKKASYGTEKVSWAAFYYELRIDSIGYHLPCKNDGMRAKQEFEIQFVQSLGSKDESPPLFFGSPRRYAKPIVNYTL